MRYLRWAAIFLLLGAITLLASASTRTSSPAPDERIERAGTVRAWHLDTRGIVSFQLDRLPEGGDSGEPPGGPSTPGLWYHTPGNQSGSTHLEELVLAVLFRMEAEGRPVRVVAERSANETGASIEEACTLISLQSEE